jgi:hypothetical protein
MKIKFFAIATLLMAVTSVIAQQKLQPVLITLKDGTNIDVHHFGQLQCGKNVYSNDYVITRGKFMDAPTEIKDYKEIEKIVLEGYSKEPVTSIGNEKGTLRITKKDGRTVTLTDAELAMSCYAPGDKYNELIVQIINPLTDKPSEQPIETRKIQSIIFK